jgi:hypothetical protein
MKHLDLGLILIFTYALITRLTILLLSIKKNEIDKIKLNFIFLIFILILVAVYFLLNI